MIFRPQPLPCSQQSYETLLGDHKHQFAYGLSTKWGHPGPGFAAHACERVALLGERSLGRKF